MPIPAAIDASWKLVFDDEFGTTLNATRWTTNWGGTAGQVTRPVNSYEKACMDPALATVEGGALRLRLVAQSTVVGGVTYPYRGALCHSSNKVDFSKLPVYIEWRALGDFHKNWPCLWLNPYTWPVGGEFDVMESLGGGPQFNVHAGATADADTFHPSLATPAGNWTGVHTYGCLWEAGKVTRWYDGQSLGSVSSPLITSVPHYIIMTMSTGTQNWNSPVVAPAEINVDYVRVWSANAAAIAVTPEAGFDGGAVSPPPSPPPPSPPPPPATDYGVQIAALDARVTALETAQTAQADQMVRLDTRLDAVSKGATG